MIHTRTTWHHIRRSPYQALAAILIMMVTFLAISVFTFLIVGSTKAIQYFESKPQVTAFFKEEATKEQIDALSAQLTSTGQIEKVKFISKEDALQIYRQQNKDDPLLLDLVTADILPASLEISPKNIQTLPTISAEIKKSPIVGEVVFQKEVVGRLTEITTLIRQLGITLIIVLATISIFIMSTIIGIRVSQKREEIEVLRLLGATKWYISFPFLLEGVFYGLVGTLLGWLIASGGLLYATPYFKGFVGDIPLFPIPWQFFISLFGGEIILAILLGFFSSWIAVSRYVK